MGSYSLCIFLFTRKITMRGLVVITLAVLLLIASSEAKISYSEIKGINCPFLFPDTKHFVAGRLNETISGLGTDYWSIRSGIDAALDTVVDAQVTACETIGKAIAGIGSTTAATT